MAKLYIFLLLLLSWICCICCISQTEQVIVEKVIGKGEKYFLNLQYQDGEKKLESNVYYLDGFDKLDDRIKLQFIAKLLSFEGDTSLCVHLPYPWYFTNNAQNRYFKPKSNYQTIAVNALYLINRIAFDNYTDYYAPAPVLFDRELNMEINDDPVKIKIVFEAYYNWFEKCRAVNRISEYFPFNDGRYVWLFGQESKFPKDDFLKDCF